jgi:hypothetical protein
MTDMMVRAPTFDFPAPEKPFGGLLDVASVTEGIAFLEPEGLTESYNCLRLDSVAVWPCPTVASPKQFLSKPGWVDGIRFAVYGGINCKGPGFSMDDAQVKGRAAFEAMESVGVERALMKNRFVVGPTWAAPPDLTPAGGAVSPAAALGLLEGDAACKYAGTPILHLPRTVASMLTTNGQISRDGNSLVTGLGSRVAAGGGYSCPNQGPGGTAPAAGEMWAYASGGVAIARGDLIVQADIDRTTNEVYVLIERPYVAAVDCYTAAVRVKVT